MDVDVDADMDSWATVTISTSSAQATKILAWIYGKAQIIVFIFDAYISHTHKHTQWHEGASVCVCKYKMTAIYPDAACSADVALWERFMGFTCVQVGA